MGVLCVTRCTVLVRTVFHSLVVVSVGDRGWLWCEIRQRLSRRCLMFEVGQDEPRLFLLHHHFPPPATGRMQPGLPQFNMSVAAYDEQFGADHSE